MRKREIEAQAKTAGAQTGSASEPSGADADKAAAEANKVRLWRVYAALVGNIDVCRERRGWDKACRDALDFAFKAVSVFDHNVARVLAARPKEGL